MYSLIIKNALVVDGLNRAPYSADLAIQGDTIVEIGKLEGSAKRTIDAQGKIVTPGFIDIHCHSDAIVFYPKKNPKRLQQGFTTEVIGNCGISAAPVAPKYRDLLEKYCAPYYSNIPVPYDWRTYEEYLLSIEQHQPMLNMATLVGHGTLRVAVAGFEARELSGEEMDQMKELLHSCLRAGAFGMSSGLIYPPGIFATAPEMLELAKVVAMHDGTYTTHMRSESDGLVDAVAQSIQIARETGVNMEISHHKAAGKRNHGKTKQTLEMIEQANREGLKVDCDVYPYDAASTQFSAVLPPWALEGGVDQLLARLTDLHLRTKMIDDIKNPETNFENFFQLSGWDKIFINECVVAQYVGKTVAQIALENHCDPFEMALDIIKNSGNDVMMIVFFMDEEDVSRVVQSPYSIICTDGFPSLGKYHPRYLSSFIRVLEKYVKQEYLLSLPQAIYKMTGRPAQKLGLKDRGMLKVGAKADLLILDFPKLHDNSNYDQHDALADGLDYVIINGQIALEQGTFHPICAGKVLRSTD